MANNSGFFTLVAMLDAILDFPARHHLCRQFTYYRLCGTFWYITNFVIPGVRVPIFFLPRLSPYHHDSVVFIVYVLVALVFDQSLLQLLVAIKSMETYFSNVKKKKKKKQQKNNDKISRKFHYQRSQLTSGSERKNSKT